MRIMIKATMSTQRDADMFNDLSVYCAKKLSKMDAVQDGVNVVIDINGPTEMLEELRDFLVERNMGVI